MNLLELASLFFIFLFGSLAVYFSFKEYQARKKLEAQNKLHNQKIFEISILKEIQDRIGYSLNVEEVVDVITASLKNLFFYSTVSSAVLKPDRVIFKTHIEEQVGRRFVEDTKQSMLASLNALVPFLPQKTEEQILGLPLNDSNQAPVASFFHIPLVVSNQVVGLINISSAKPNQYKEDEMTMLYQITGLASKALTRLHEVLDTEKGKLTSMISSLSDGVFMVDNEKNILIINNSAKRLLNILSPNPAFFDILSAFPREFDILGKIEKVRLTHLTSKEEEVSINGKILIASLTPVVSSSQNRVLGIAFLLKDVTLEKNISEIKEDFTNMMVHELRAPLTNIKDAASLLLGEKLNEEEKEQFLTMISSQAKILLGQVSDLLDASKIEAGKFTIQKSPSDLGKIANEVVKSFLAQAEKKGVLLSLSLKPIPAVEIDQTRITQVLNNLISNSLKFTNAGGKITVNVEQKGLPAGRQGDFVQVSVSDTGIGIPKEKQKDIFSKFYQVERSGNSQKGTGLGLYLVKGVVEAHNGTIKLQSEEGKGTTISFTLPLNKTASFSANYRTLN